MKRLKFGPHERFQIRARDGYTLEAELILPTDMEPGKKYPVWFTTYGGPHAPQVSDAWNGGRMRDHAMASEGLIIFHMDPRSASGKGAISSWTAYKHLGVQETKDIEDAINWLKQKPYVDGTRIGMSGHSYGGYITSYAMTHTNLFAAGIAGAPVTDWRDYDSIYTERYMGPPQDNPDGYNVSSVVKAAGKLHGRLLILHGAIDDNVSLRNTMRFVQALQLANKDFELMIYPSSRHGIGGALHPHPAGVHPPDLAHAQGRARETPIARRDRDALGAEQHSAGWTHPASGGGSIALTTCDRSDSTCDWRGMRGWLESTDERFLAIPAPALNERGSACRPRPRRLPRSMTSMVWRERRS